MNFIQNIFKKTIIMFFVISIIAHNGLAGNTVYLAPPAGEAVSIAAALQGLTPFQSYIKDTHAITDDQTTRIIQFLIEDLPGWPQNPDDVVKTNSFTYIDGLIQINPSIIGSLTDFLEQSLDPLPNGLTTSDRPKLLALMMYAVVLSKIDDLIIRCENKEFSNTPEDRELLRAVVAELCTQEYWSGYTGFSSHISEYFTNIIGNAREVIDRKCKDEYKLTNIIDVDYLKVLRAQICKRDFSVSVLLNSYYYNPHKIILSYLYSLEQYDGISLADLKDENFWRTALSVKGIYTARVRRKEINYKKLVIEIERMMILIKELLIEELHVLKRVSDEGMELELKTVFYENPTGVMSALFNMVNGWEWRDCFDSISMPKIYYEFDRAGKDLYYFLGSHKRGDIIMPASGFARVWKKEAFFDVFIESHPEYELNNQRLGAMLHYYWNWYKKLKNAYPWLNHNDILELMHSSSIHAFGMLPDLSLYAGQRDLDEQTYFEEIFTHAFRSIVHDSVRKIYQIAYYGNMSMRNSGTPYTVRDYAQQFFRDATEDINDLRIVFNYIPPSDQLNSLSSEEWVALITQFYIDSAKEPLLYTYFDEFSKGTKKRLVEIFDQNNPLFHTTISSRRTPAGAAVEVLKAY